jgi:hypothetical protein
LMSFCGAWEQGPFKPMKLCLVCVKRYNFAAGLNQIIGKYGYLIKTTKKTRGVWDGELEEKRKEQRVGIWKLKSLKKGEEEPRKGEERRREATKGRRKRTRKKRCVV